MLIMLLVFEDTNLFRLFRYKYDLYQIRKENAAKESEIKTITKKTAELTSNPASLERFARETYLMKKQDEVVFLFVEDTTAEDK